VDVRDAIKRVLERAGYAVRTCADAVQALQELNRQPAHVVITDIIMPKVNGVEAIRSLVNDFPSIRVIAISGGGNFGIDSYKPNAITTTAYLAAADLVRAIEKELAMGQSIH
jgi:CheY-like chemotaxis protein